MWRFYFLIADKDGDEDLFVGAGGNDLPPKNQYLNTGSIKMMVKEIFQRILLHLKRTIQI